MASRPAVGGAATCGLASVRPWGRLRSIALLPLAVLGEVEGRCPRGLKRPVADGWVVCLLVGGEGGCGRREEPLGTP